MNTSTQHKVVDINSQQHSDDADFILTGFFLLLVPIMVLNILKVNTIRSIKNLFKK